MNVSWLNFRNTVFTVFVVGWTIIITFSLFYISNLQFTKEIQFAHKRSNNLEQVFDLEIAENTDRIDAIIAFIEKDPIIIEAWLAKDREKLLEHLESQFSYLRLRHKITHFYFHDNSGKNYLRIHKPEKYGDQINRESMRRARETGEIAHGLEFGTLGHFVLRVVKPWRYKGEVIGYIELGEEIDQIIERLAKANDYDLYLGVKKDYLTELSSEILPNITDTLSQTDLLDKYIITTQVVNSNRNLLRSFINGYESKQALINKERGQHILWSGAPILDINENHAATLFFSSQITESIEFASRDLNQYILLCTILGVFISGYIYIYSGRLQKKIN